MMENSYRFFANKACKYYPCHAHIEEINCLFCYCPLYERKHCPGSPEYINRKENGSLGKAEAETSVGIKSCMHCTFPHRADNYEIMMQFLKKGNA